MQNTRTAILDYLDTHPDSSAAEIGRLLEMTPANIRYHLAILEKEGLIQVSGKRPAGGSGRPILLYNLNSQCLGDNTIPLVGAFLDALVEGDDYLLILERIISHLGEDFEFDAQNRISSFNQAVAFLNDHHYRASWKATPEGPQIELRHCPYQDLATTHPQLCQIDTKFIKSLFDLDLEFIQKREFGTNPFSPCIFKPPAEQ